MIKKNKKIQALTKNYLEKLCNLYVVGEENIGGELFLMLENNSDLESLLLNCLYNASRNLDINPLNVKENGNEFCRLQNAFFKEIRKTYMEYTLKRRNNSKNDYNHS